MNDNMTEEKNPSKFPGVGMRIFGIIGSWYGLPLCVGIVEGAIRNDFDGSSLLLALFLFPFMAWFSLMQNIFDLCYILSFRNTAAGSILGLLSLLTAATLYISAFVLSILYCIKPRMWYWITVSFIISLASFRMSSIFAGMMKV